MNNIDARDWFAGQALSALLNRAEFQRYSPAKLAESAYKIADAMMDNELRPSKKPRWVNPED